MIHRLKCWPRMFEATERGAKTAEFRKADRVFKVGDSLILEEWDPYEVEYTGRRSEIFAITHILRSDSGVGMPEGYVMLSLGRP